MTILIDEQNKGATIQKLNYDTDTFLKDIEGSTLQYPKNLRKCTNKMNTSKAYLLEGIEVIPENWIKAPTVYAYFYKQSIDIENSLDDEDLMFLEYIFNFYNQSLKENVKYVKLLLDLQRKDVKIIKRLYYNNNLLDIFDALDLLSYSYNPAYVDEPNKDLMLKDFIISTKLNKYNLIFNLSLEDLFSDEDIIKKVVDRKTFLFQNLFIEEYKDYIEENEKEGLNFKLLLMHSPILALSSLNIPGYIKDNIAYKEVIVNDLNGDDIFNVLTEDIAKEIYKALAITIEDLTVSLDYNINFKDYTLNKLISYNFNTLYDIKKLTYKEQVFILNETIKEFFNKNFDLEKPEQPSLINVFTINLLTNIVNTIESMKALEDYIYDNKLSLMDSQRLIRNYTISKILARSLKYSRYTKFDARHTSIDSLEETVALEKHIQKNSKLFKEQLEPFKDFSFNGYDIPNLDYNDTIYVIQTLLNMGFSPGKVVGFEIKEESFNMNFLPTFIPEYKIENGKVIDMFGKEII